MRDLNEKLYQELLEATKDGKSAEVKRNSQGNFIIYSVTKKRKDIKMTTV